jgi:adenine deaminase
MTKSSSALHNSEKLFERIRVAKGDIHANLVVKNISFLDVFSGGFNKGDIAIHDGVIAGISEVYEGETEIDGTGMFAVPGFIDSHVHIESSLMTPRRFQEAVLPCGTTSVIWDPHEIANVKGIEGIQWAIDSTEGLLLDVFIMIPSCVPSTSPNFGLESSGAELTAKHLTQFRDHPRVLGLAEMMNFPGMLMGDPDVLQKLVDFSGLKLDGHCPGLRGKDLNAYASAGIHSCHESISLDEAKEKLMKGIHVLIREGSCAKNAATLLPLLNSYSSAVLALCSDDRNPADIAAEGHISYIIDLALKSGFQPEDIFRAASYSPAKLYNLPHRGALAPGYVGDICLVRQRNNGDWLGGMQVKSVLKSGKIVTTARLNETAGKIGNAFPSRNLHVNPITHDDMNVPCGTHSKYQVRVIDVIPNQIVTEESIGSLSADMGNILASMEQDILKIAVIERHKNSQRKFVAFVRGFKLRKGAIATSINHDSHNIIAVGASERDIAAAVNRLIEIDGGIVVTDGNGQFVELPLPLGGLMTDAAPADVTSQLKELKALTHSLGCCLTEPFLQLSFLALPVIPKLKITDRGLVDVTQFKIIPVILD